MSTEKLLEQNLLGYAPVSSLLQKALQVDALKSGGCHAPTFTDKASGKLEHRPAINVMLE